MSSSTCRFMASSPRSLCTWAACLLYLQRRTPSNAQSDYAATHVAEELLAPKRGARTIAQNFLEELDEDERHGPSFVKMLETKKQILKGADPNWMVVHSFFASQSEENSDSRFVQRFLECLPTEEKAVPWALEESDLKKLQATPLGRYAGRAISSHVKQILSWITAGMQRTMMNIP